jgi:hypothetical protein
MSKRIRLNGVSKELRARLEKSAEQNFRSLNKEALARLDFSFDIEDAFQTELHQNWIDEAFSGTFRAGSIGRLKQIAARAKAGKSGWHL